ncbi:ABC transporter ATP-binding protein [[Acholeplasma] multilocale]|uniref:ABC transporter ATP-binding protein n=1 Tax=[Acholeplasma] multilocale TaxID=264638 RepID=UPI0004004095|nr:ABC transporter ATP-binding protein [[Acholeplasma] multilocale]
MEIIKVEGLSKKYKERIAVNNLNFSINKGEFFALLGVNGAGKSTTINMITGLTKMDSGTIQIMGKDTKKDWKEVSHKISTVPQELGLGFNLTVYQNLEFIYDIYQKPKEDKKIKIEEMMETLKLIEYRNLKAKKISGGYQRRLSIAMGLMTEPEILFLDEPTTGLDVVSRKLLWDELLRIKNERGLTVILTTHYLEEANLYADRVAIISKGFIKVLDTPENIISSVDATTFDEAFIKITGGL